MENSSRVADSERFDAVPIRFLNTEHLLFMRNQKLIQTCSKIVDQIDEDKRILQKKINFNPVHICFFYNISTIFHVGYVKKNRISTESFDAETTKFLGMTG